MITTREDSPDWLRSFQAPTHAVTTLSSDSEPSGDKSPMKCEGDEEQDGSVSDILMQSDVNKSSNKRTSKKRVKIGDEIPSKRRKTEKRKKGGGEYDEDIKEEGSDEPMEASAPNHLIWALSSDSESHAEVSMIKGEANEESSTQIVLELINKGEKSDNAGVTPDVVMTRKSPRKKLKTEDVKLKEGEKANATLELGNKEERSDNADVTSDVVITRKSPRKRLKKEDVKLKKEEKANETLELGNKEERSDTAEVTPDVVMKRKSPKKRLKTENVKLKEEKKTNETLILVNEEEKSDNAEVTQNAVMKQKSLKKRLKTEDVKPEEEKKTNENVKIGEDMDVPEEAIPEKHAEHRVTSSTLPLVLPEKVNRSKALVECEGESIDLGGDMGAVGRVIIAETPSKDPEMFLDLKGTIYKTTIVPSRTFCVVTIGQSEAKIEAIMNDFIQLAPQSNVYDAETMVEGTLDGFSFDSEDEGDKTTKDTKVDQTEGGEERPNAKSNGKAEKKRGATQKKGKAAGSKQPKKRKPQAPKKGKAKK